MISLKYAYYLLFYNWIIETGYFYSCIIVVTLFNYTQKKTLLKNEKKNYNWNYSLFITNK